MTYALRVKKKEANSLLKKMFKKRLVDGRFEIIEEGEYIIVPLKKPIDGAFEHSFPTRDKEKRPYDKIISIAKKKGIICDLPSRWEKIGDIILLQKFECNPRYIYDIGEIYAKILKAKAVCIYIGVEGELRTQKIRCIYGHNSETIHIENQIKYKLDVSKIMFSSGNVNERIRISRLNMRGETVVDMFAGIGYFTLPAAKAGASRIYACEKNPVAFYYLLENIRLNGFGNIVPLFGDNRNVCPEGVADRVIMGYFDTLPFVPHALRSLRDGGIIHYHDLARRKDAQDLVERVTKEITRWGFTAEVLERRVVKSYAPRIWHVVLDINVER